MIYSIECFFKSINIVAVNLPFSILAYQLSVDFSRQVTAECKDLNPDCL